MTMKDPPRPPGSGPAWRGRGTTSRGPPAEPSSPLPQLLEAAEAADAALSASSPAASVRNIASSRPRLVLTKKFFPDSVSYLYAVAQLELETSFSRATRSPSSDSNQGAAAGRAAREEEVEEEEVVDRFVVDVGIVVDFVVFGVNDRPVVQRRVLLCTSGVARDAQEESMRGHDDDVQSLSLASFVASISGFDRRKTNFFFFDCD